MGDEVKNWSTMTELDFLANFLPIPIPELELNWSCHHLNSNRIRNCALDTELDSELLSTALKSNRKSLNILILNYSVMELNGI